MECQHSNLTRKPGTGYTSPDGLMYELFSCDECNALLTQVVGKVRPCDHISAKHTGERMFRDGREYLFEYRCESCGKSFGDQRPPGDDGMLDPEKKICGITEHDLLIDREEERTCCGGNVLKTKVFKCRLCGAEFRIE